MTAILHSLLFIKSICSVYRLNILQLILNQIDLLTPPLPLPPPKKKYNNNNKTMPCSSNENYNNDFAIDSQTVMNT